LIAKVTSGLLRAGRGTISSDARIVKRARSRATNPRVFWIGRVESSAFAGGYAA
jgi:hypothetical protein